MGKSTFTLYLLITETIFANSAIEVSSEFEAIKNALGQV